MLLRYGTFCQPCKELGANVSQQMLTWLKKITFLLHEYKTDGNSDQEYMYSIHLFILKDIYLLFFPAEFQIFSSPCICKIEEGTTCQSDISGDEQSQKCLAVWILSFLVSCVASSSFSLQNYVVEIFNGFMGRKEMASIGKG